MRRYDIVRAGAGLILAGMAFPGLALEFPGSHPGPAQAEVRPDHLRLGNQVLSCAWTTADGQLKPVEVADRIGKRTIDLQGTETFRLTLADGRSLAASDLRVIGKPSLEALPPKPGASILAHRSPGRQVVVRLESADGNLAVEWRAILRDSANAVRQEIAFMAKEKAIPVKETRLMELPAAGATVVGSVPGSPVVIGNLFFAYEHPDSQSAIAERATCSLAFNVSLPPGQPVVQS